ncbi:MAG: PDZ domain-containing protein [Candidatus Omnitrophica bacterium]|nr:PDZ domain-containing protein [Candidatus Omnitrophota bacterium]
MLKGNLVWGLVLVVLLGLCGVGISQVTAQNKKDLYAQVELFSNVLMTVQSEYVDEKSPKDLIYGALRGMLSSLDPHSQFLDPDEYKELKTETEGKFGGLGIEVSIKDGLLTIITPVEDSPAWKAGIKAGDRIVNIGHDVTRDMTLDEAVKKLRGKPGTRVILTILRESNSLVKDFSLTREMIHVDDIKDAHLLGDHIGYVRLTEFRENSYFELHKALKQLKGQGMDSLILDLRNNPGGLLDVVSFDNQRYFKGTSLGFNSNGQSFLIR